MVNLPGADAPSGSRVHSEIASPIPSPDLRAILRAHWEVIAALGIMVFVLAVLDIVVLHSPKLIIASAPVLFLLHAGLRPLSSRMLLGWYAAFVLLAIVLGNADMIVLAYPGVALSAVTWAWRKRVFA